MTQKGKQTAENLANLFQRLSDLDKERLLMFGEGRTTTQPCALCTPELLPRILMIAINPRTHPRAIKFPWTSSESLEIRQDSCGFLPSQEKFMTQICAR